MARGRCCGAFGQKDMTDQEAIALAEEKAVELNVPWSQENVTALRRRLWPFPPYWRVIARVTRDGAIVTMRVSEASREACPVNVRYPVGGVV